jgi:hypothetical protein
MTSHSYTYQSTLRDALKVNWRVEDLIGGNKLLDFRKPFLPDSLAGVNDIQCLNHREKLILNQIRGNSYLHLFALVEEFIIPMVLEQLQRMGYDDIYAAQALLCFAEEESKHIHLFRRFAEEFELSFGTLCACVGPTRDITNAILKHSALGILCITLHFEWMTQSHYLESIRDNEAENLDPQFCSMLKHHWMEEAQHTKMDTLLVNQLTREIGSQETETGIEDYLAIVKMLEEKLITQVQLDLESLSKAAGRTFTVPEKQEIQTTQEQSYRWTFLCAGMTHPNFVKILSELSQTGQARVTQLAKALS